MVKYLFVCLCLCEDILCLCEDICNLMLRGNVLDEDGVATVESFVQPIIRDAMGVRNLSVLSIAPRLHHANSGLVVLSDHQLGDIRCK